MSKLILVRHGQSQWNLENRFTGWHDVNLTEQGEREGREAGRQMKEAGFAFDMAYTSVLTRAIRTLWLALTEMEQVEPYEPSLCMRPSDPFEPDVNYSSLIPQFEPELIPLGRFGNQARIIFERPAPIIDNPARFIHMRSWSSRFGGHP